VAGPIAHHDAKERAGPIPHHDVEEPAGPIAGHDTGQRAGLMRGVLEVFLVFLRLGCTSFGGPVAHLGYYRAELVARRHWLSEATFADIVALCQFMPGPASSQTGMAIGLLRAGPLGMVAAWFGFTVPSALAMTLFGYGAGVLGDLSLAGWLRGLKLVAVAVVAQAVWGMASSLAPDRARGSVAVAACLLCLGEPSSLGQIAAILLGGVIGATALPREPQGTGTAARMGICINSRRRDGQPHHPAGGRVLPKRLIGVRRRACRAAAAPDDNGGTWLG